MCDDRHCSQMIDEGVHTWWLVYMRLVKTKFVCILNFGSNYPEFFARDYVFWVERRGNIMNVPNRMQQSSTPTQIRFKTAYLNTPIFSFRYKIGLFFMISLSKIQWIQSFSTTKFR